MMVSRSILRSTPRKNRDLGRPGSPRGDQGPSWGDPEIKNPQIPTCQNSKIRICENSKIRICQNAKIPKFENAKMPKFENSKILKFQNSKLENSPKSISPKNGFNFILLRRRLVHPELQGAEMLIMMVSGPVSRSTPETAPGPPGSPGTASLMKMSHKTKNSKTRRKPRKSRKVM